MQAKTLKKKQRPFTGFVHLNARAYGLLTAITASALLLMWRLSSQTGNYLNSFEIATKHQLYLNSPWWKSVSNIYGPYYVLLHATYAIGRNVWTFRLASVVVGILVIAALYWIVSTWHGYKIGLLASAICLTSFGFLAISREATPISSQLLVTIFLVIAIDLIKRNPGFKSLLFLVAVFACSLYVPGAVWLIIAALALTYKQIMEVFGQLSSSLRLTIIGTGLLLITPIANFLIRFSSMSNLATWLGYGLNGKVHALKEFLTNFLHTPMTLFIHSYAINPISTLGHLPLIPIAYSALIVVGLITYITRISNWRWRTLIFLLGASWLLCGFNVISPLSLIPLLSICGATGIAYILKEWYSVFPRNQIARAIGLIVAVGVLSLGAFYGVRSYIVAWSHTPSVIASYKSKLN